MLQVGKVRLQAEIIISTHQRMNRSCILSMRGDTSETITVGAVTAQPIEAVTVAVTEAVTKEVIQAVTQEVIQKVIQTATQTATQALNQGSVALIYR